MSAPDFTPSPWEARPCLMEEDTHFRKKGEPTGEWDVVYSDGKEAAGSDPWFVALAIDGAPGTTEANARLISASPELYAAAEEARGMLEILGDDNMSPELAEALDHLDEALAKARGEAA